MLADRRLAVFAHPALQAHAVAGLLAAVVAEVIVTWPALLVALAAVVVLVTLETDAVLEARHGPIVLDGLPVVARVDHACVDAPLNQQLLVIVAGGVVPVPGLHDEGVRPRPCVLKRDENLASIVDFVLVILRILKRKNISTKNVCRSNSVGARASGCDLGLVLL